MNIAAPVQQVESIGIVIDDRGRQSKGMSTTANGSKVRNAQNMGRGSYRAANNFSGGIANLQDKVVEINVRDAINQYLNPEGHS